LTDTQKQITAAYELYKADPRKMEQFLNSCDPIIMFVARREGLLNWYEDIRQLSHLQILRVLKYYKGRGSVSAFIIKHLQTESTLRLFYAKLKRYTGSGSLFVSEELMDNYGMGLYSKDPSHDVQEIELYESIKADALLFINKRSPHLKEFVLTKLRCYMYGEPLTYPKDRHEQEKIEISVRYAMLKNRGINFTIEKVL